MSTGRESPTVVIVYVSSLLIGIASELPHARPVIGPMAYITDIHIKTRGLRSQGFFATRIVADLTASTFNSARAAGSTLAGVNPAFLDIDKRSRFWGIWPGEEMFGLGSRIVWEIGVCGRQGAGACLQLGSCLIAGQLVGGRRSL
eukprot:1141182-Pelagomonas_calceolata.AAC.3